MGHFHRFTPEVRSRILEAIEDCNAYIETAAAYAGISKQTFYNWMRIGGRARDKANKGKQLTPMEMEFADFHRDVEREIAKAKMADLRTIKDASKEDWRAAAWRLERRDSKYARPTKTMGGEGSNDPPTIVFENIAGVALADLQAERAAKEEAKRQGFIMSPGNGENGKGPNGSNGEG